LVNGAGVALPDWWVDRPVIEYRPAPGLTPWAFSEVVRVTVQGVLLVGAPPVGQVPSAVAAWVGLKSAEVVDAPGFAAPPRR
jgi:hypothetical protein